MYLVQYYVFVLLETIVVPTLDEFLGVTLNYSNIGETVELLSMESDEDR